jgi:hypothetical protein
VSHWRESLKRRVGWTENKAGVSAKKDRRSDCKPQGPLSPSGAGHSNKSASLSLAGPLSLAYVLSRGSDAAGDSMGSEGGSEVLRRGRLNASRATNFGSVGPY